MHYIQERILRLSKTHDLTELSMREIGRQIADDTDRVHPQLVKYHWGKLVDAGLLTARKQHSGYRISSRSQKALDLVAIPIVGDADCGPATIFAEERVKGYIKISVSMLLSRNYRHLYALKASGNSMNKACVCGVAINSGDFVIVDSSKRSPRNGEYVVAIDDEKANIKKLFLDYLNKQIVLTSESYEDYAPIFIDPEDKWDSLIGGTVVQVVKYPSIDESQRVAAE